MDFTLLTDSQLEQLRKDTQAEQHKLEKQYALIILEQSKRYGSNMARQLQQNLLHWINS